MLINLEILLFLLNLKYKFVIILLVIFSDIVTVALPNMCMNLDFNRFIDCLIEQNRNISYKKKINSRDFNFVLCSSYLIQKLYLEDNNNLLLKQLYDKNLLIINSILVRFGL